MDIVSYKLVKDISDGSKAITPLLKGHVETVAVASVQGDVTLDLSEGNIHEWSITGPISSIAVSGIASSGKAHSFRLILHTPDPAPTIEWFEGIKWEGGYAPSISLGEATYVLTFFSTDGGVTWYGAEVGEFISLDVVSIESLDPVSVSLGTSIGDIGLPESVTATLKNGATEEIQVSWV